MSNPLFGLSAFDQTDGTTYAQAVARSETDLGIKAGFVYFSPATTPNWTDRCDDHPQDHDLVISIKRYVSDSQWITDHQNFANQIPVRDGRIIIVCNEEPETDLTGTEFKRRWDLVRTIWENEPNVSMGVCLQEWTLNPLSSRPVWTSWVTSYMEYIGWSIYTYTPDVEDDIATPASELVGRVTAAMGVDGREWGSIGWGCGVINSIHPIGDPFRVTRAQWLYDSAQLCAQGGASHVLWFDFDWTSQGSIDLRIRTAVEGGNLKSKWDQAFGDFSSQANAGGPVVAAFVDEDHNSTGTGAAVNQLSTTVPSTAEEGNLLVAVWQGVSSGLVTNYATPGGWTERLAPQSFNSGTQTIAVCSKICALADIGATFNFGTLTANRRQNIAIFAFSDAVWDSITSLAATLTGTTTPPVGSIDPVLPDCLLLAIALLQHPAANTALITATPAVGPDWIERLDIGTSSAGGVNHGSLYVQELQHSGSGASAADTFPASHSVQYGALVIALATAAIVVSVGQVTEQDIVNALSLTLGVNRVTETDTAMPVTNRVTHTVGQVIETDIAMAVTWTGGAGSGGAGGYTTYQRGALGVGMGLSLGIRP